MEYDGCIEDPGCCDTECSFLIDMSMLIAGKSMLSKSSRNWEFNTKIVLEMNRPFSSN